MPPVYPLLLAGILKLFGTYTLPAFIAAASLEAGLHLMAPARALVDAAGVPCESEVGVGDVGTNTFTTGRCNASENTVGCSWVTKAMLQLPARGYSTKTTRRNISLFRPLSASTIWRIEL